jgi:hypothetical protein
MDLYGPASFFRLHVLTESALPAGMLHFGLVFPWRHRWARLRIVGWLIALAIAVAYELCLYSPIWYSRILTTNMLYLAAVAMFFCLNVVVAYLRSGSQLVRQRVRVVLVGALLGFVVPAVVLAFAAVMAGTSMNSAATTPFVFGLAPRLRSLARPLRIDAMVGSGAPHLVLTGTSALPVSRSWPSTSAAFRRRDRLRGLPDRLRARRAAAVQSAPDASPRLRRPCLLRHPL